MGQTTTRPEIVTTFLNGCKTISTSSCDLTKAYDAYYQHCQKLRDFIKEPNQQSGHFSEALKQKYKSLKGKIYDQCLKLSSLNASFLTTLKMVELELEYFKNIEKTDASAKILIAKILSYEKTFNELSQSFEKYKDELERMGHECVEIGQQMDEEIPKKNRNWSIAGIVVGCLVAVGGIASIVLGFISLFSPVCAQMVAPKLFTFGVSLIVTGVGLIVPSASELSKIDYLKNETSNVANEVSKTANNLSEIITQCKLLANNKDFVAVTSEMKRDALQATIDLMKLMIKSSLESSTKLEASVAKLVASVLK